MPGDDSPEIIRRTRFEHRRFSQPLIASYLTRSKLKMRREHFSREALNGSCINLWNPVDYFLVCAIAKIKVHLRRLKLFSKYDSRQDVP